MTTIQIPDSLVQEIEQLRLEQLFHHLPIAAFPDEFYGVFLSDAHRLIDTRDPEDADVLALALQTRLPVWTEDHDFDQVREVQVIRTAQLARMK